MKRPTDTQLKNQQRHYNIMENLFPSQVYTAPPANQEPAYEISNGILTSTHPLSHFNTLFQKHPEVAFSVTPSPANLCQWLIIRNPFYASSIRHLLLDDRQNTVIYRPVDNNFAITLDKKSAMKLATYSRHQYIATTVLCEPATDAYVNAKRTLLKLTIKATTPSPIKSIKEIINNAGKQIIAASNLLRMLYALPPTCTTRDTIHHVCTLRDLCINHHDPLINEFLSNQPIESIPKHRAKKYCTGVQNLINDLGLATKHGLFDNLFPVGQSINGSVTTLSKQGACIRLDQGICGFIPISELSWSKDISSAKEVLKIGQKVDAVVLGINKGSHGISLSLRKTKSDPWESYSDNYWVGKEIVGKVTKVTPDHAIITIEDGISGTVYFPDYPWIEQVAHAAKILRIGQTVYASIVSVNAENRRFRLNLPFLASNPWERFRNKHAIGTKICGKVCHLANSGAVIELEEGVSGFVDITDISWTRRIVHPADALQMDAEVEAVVLDVDSSLPRIALGIKQTHEDPWAVVERNYCIGDVVIGKVSKITNFGAFIELGEGVNGLIHISEISEAPFEKIEDVLRVGQEISARLIKIDKDTRRVGLTLKGIPHDTMKFKSEINSDQGNTIAQPDSP